MAIGPGTLLMGRYQVGKDPLAIGGMGKVWPGRDRTFDRDVAIKVMLNPDQTNKDLLERFRLEAQVAANLEHPRFTVVHDFGDLEGELFIVMERMRGQDLRALIQRNPRGMPVPLAVNLARQMAEALTFAHSKGVVHHDLKPANLFVLSDNWLKVCDFGIAKVAGVSTFTTPEQNPGTLGYMAPEQLQGVRGDGRSDLYSLGCILYEMLTGQPPFPRDQDSHAQMYQHLHVPPQPPRGTHAIPGELEGLVLRLLAKDVEGRPRSAVEALAKLREIGQLAGTAGRYAASGQQWDPGSTLRPSASLDTSATETLDGRQAPASQPSSPVSTVESPVEEPTTSRPAASPEAIPVAEPGTGAPADPVNSVLPPGMPNAPLPEESGAKEPPRGGPRAQTGVPADDAQRVKVRDLPPDVRLRFWRIRITIAVIVGAAFAALTRSWEIALTLAVLAGILDAAYRSHNAANYCNGPQPGARRRASRQLSRIQREGYLSVEGRHFPDSLAIIDHLVVGPHGVHVIDSEKWDGKLTVRSPHSQQLYLGPESQNERLDNVAWEAAQASALLTEALGAEIPVRPALAIYGPKIPWDIATIRDVDVFTGSALGKYLKRRGRRKDGAVMLTPEEVRTIYDTALRLLPDGRPQMAAKRADDSLKR